MGAAGFLVKVSIFALIAAAFVHILLHNDYFKRVYNHQPGPCRLVKPVVDGSEDLELLPNGFAVITSGLRYLKSVETDNVVGKLFLFNFNVDATAEPKADEVKLIWNAAGIKTFNPHGVKSLVNNNGETILYVISHPPGGDIIELFSLDVQKKRSQTFEIHKTRTYNGRQQLGHSWTGRILREQRPLFPRTLTGAARVHASVHQIGQCSSLQKWSGQGRGQFPSHAQWHDHRQKTKEFVRSLTPGSYADSVRN